MAKVISFSGAWFAASLVFTIGMLIDALPSFKINVVSFAAMFANVGLVVGIYFFVVGVPAYLLLRSMKKLNFLGFLSCGIVCSLPMVLIGITDGATVWVITPIIVGVISGIVFWVLYNKYENV